MPIFTQQFLTHYKNREDRLKFIRAESEDFASKNSMLIEQVEHMKLKIQELDESLKVKKLAQQQAASALIDLRKQIFQVLSEVSMPGSNAKVTKLGDVENFLLKLGDYVEGPRADAAFTAKLSQTLQVLGADIV
eukprot:m.122469 g.122469  ORF g.122469 m.122469 type:complete len:134 (-) comp28923_c2_seq1:45-446(-)